MFRPEAGEDLPTVDNIFQETTKNRKMWTVGSLPTSFFRLQAEGVGLGFGKPIFPSSLPFHPSGSRFRRWKGRKER
jgi:hypothetical protein